MSAATLPTIRMPRRVIPAASLGVGLAVLVFLAATPMLGDSGLQIGFRLLTAIVLAEAWNLLAGHAGLVSLGSAAFVGTGGYLLMGLMNKAGLSLGPTLALCGIGAGVLALVVSPAVFRMRGLYVTVGTLALGEALRLFMVNVPSFGGASGLFLDPVALGPLHAAIRAATPSEGFYAPCRAGHRKDSGCKWRRRIGHINPLR